MSHYRTTRQAISLSTSILWRLLPEIEFINLTVDNIIIIGSNAFFLSFQMNYSFQNVLVI